MGTHDSRKWGLGEGPVSGIATWRDVPAGPRVAGLLSSSYRSALRVPRTRLSVAAGSRCPCSSWWRAVFPGILGRGPIWDPSGLAWLCCAGMELLG